MKRVMLSSLFSYMVVGQALGADSPFINLDAATSSSSGATSLRLLRSRSASDLSRFLPSSSVNSAPADLTLSPVNNPVASSCEPSLDYDVQQVLNGLNPLPDLPTQGLLFKRALRGVTIYFAVGAVGLGMCYLASSCEASPEASPKKQAKRREESGSRELVALPFLLWGWDIKSEYDSIQDAKNAALFEALNKPEKEQRIRSMLEAKNANKLNEIREKLANCGIRSADVLSTKEALAAVHKYGVSEVTDHLNKERAAFGISHPAVFGWAAGITVAAGVAFCAACKAFNYFTKKA